MEPIVYLLAIMGCADDGSQCHRERIEPVTYQTMSQCQAAMPDALRRNGDLLYPTISAGCEADGRRSAERRIIDQNAQG